MFVGNKASWGLTDSLTLFGTLLLSAVLLHLSNLPLASLAVSFVILGAYYLGRDIRSQHTEYQNLIDFENKEKTLAASFNLTLAGLLLFGIFNVLRSYYSSSVAFALLSTGDFATIWYQTGFLYHLKFWFDVVFGAIFLKEFLVLLFKDIIGLKMPKASGKKERHEKHEKIVSYGIREEPKHSHTVKKVKVTYEGE